MTKSLGIRKAWTEAETLRAKKLYAELKSYKAVAKVMGRSESNVQDRVKGRTGDGFGHSHFAYRGDPDPIHIPQSVWDTRDKLAELPHADLTAVLMGDPQVGRRAIVGG